MKRNSRILQDDEIDLGEIIKTLWNEKILILSIWNEKILILSISLIFMIAGYVYGALQPKIYKMVNLANEFTSRCLSVDLVVLSSNGPLRKLSSPDVNVIDLGASWLLTGFVPPGLFLRKKNQRLLFQL